MHTLNEKIAFLKKRSIEIIKDGQASTGAYLACPNFHHYQYSWFRDGSFIADAMSRVGEKESAEKFFDWAASVIIARKDLIHAGDILHTRYTAEGMESKESWSNFQLDGFGTLIWAIQSHCNRHGVSSDRLAEAQELTREYIARHWQEPCHDWWEEISGIHPTTLACLYAGLHAIQDPLAEIIKDHIVLKDTKLDASLLACATPFEAVSPEAFQPTLEKLEEKLVNKSGGVHRHETDEYYGGGEWILLTCFLGWHYLKVGRKEDALKALQRALSHMTEQGELPEQVFQYMITPEKHDYWMKKWGSPACPLLWSHAMFLTLVSELDMVK